MISSLFMFFVSPRRCGGETEDVSVTFGQSSGMNRRLNQRWTASWEIQMNLSKHENHVDLSNRNVKKNVRQYKEDMETIIEV